MQECTEQEIKNVEREAARLDVRKLVASLTDTIEMGTATTTFGVTRETVKSWKNGSVEPDPDQCDQITAVWIGAHIITTRFDVNHIESWLVRNRVTVNGDEFAIPVYQAAWRGDREAVIKSANDYTPES